MANEKRLIDAEDALEVLCNYCDVEGCCPEGGCAEYQKISKLPTVDAVEVVHGRWVDNGMCNHKPVRFRNPDKWTIYKCSECGYSNGRRKNANYCPNCGAKMMDGDGNG